MLEPRYCEDCGKPLKSRTAHYCRSCSTKRQLKANNPLLQYSLERKGKKYPGSGISRFGEDNPNYKDGNTLLPHFCIDCGVKISYRALRCRPCGIQKRKKPEHVDFGDRRGENNANYKDGRTSKLYDCLDGCGNKISYWSWKSNNGRCKPCSLKLQTGENNPNWKGGLSTFPYPLIFNKSLKESIRKRDNFTCQGKDCGITEEAHLLAHGSKLDIHHIDYDKENCTPNNLISLCRMCNCSANNKRDYWLGYYKQLILAKE